MRATVRTRKTTSRTAVAVFAGIATVGLCACGDTAGSEEGADVEVLEDVH
jgi:hypothetical protein